jgi:hypothetical protein
MMCDRLRMITGGCTRSLRRTLRGRLILGLRLRSGKVDHCVLGSGCAEVVKE